VLVVIKDIEVTETGIGHPEAMFEDGLLDTMDND